MRPEVLHPPLQTPPGGGPRVPTVRPKLAGGRCPQQPPAVVESCAASPGGRVQAREPAIEAEPRVHRHRPVEARGGERPVRRDAKAHGRDPSAARARPPHPDPQHVAPMAQAVACRHAEAAYATPHAVREVAPYRLAVETRPEHSLATGPDLDRQR